jgi:ATP-dependent Clp protease adapter protein ClpS
MRRKDEDQPNDHVNNGDAGKQSRSATQNVMKDGQELKVFFVNDLLGAWYGVVHVLQNITTGQKTTA